MPPMRDPNRLFYDPVKPRMLSDQELGDLTPAELQSVNDQLDQMNIRTLRQIDEALSECLRTINDRILPLVEQHGENSAKIYESIKVRVCPSLPAPASERELTACRTNSGSNRLWSRPPLRASTRSTATNPPRANNSATSRKPTRRRPRTEPFPTKATQLASRKLQRKGPRERSGRVGPACRTRFGLRANRSGRTTCRPSRRSKPSFRTPHKRREEMAESRATTLPCGNTCRTRTGSASATCRPTRPIRPSSRR